MTNEKACAGIVVLIALVLLAALSASSGCTILKTGSVPEDSIRIGALLPLTGDMTDYGEGFQQGIDMAAADINSAGGIRGVPVTIEYRDSTGEPETAISGFNSLADSGINVIIGDASSTDTLAVAPLAEERKVVLVSPGATSPELSEYKNFVFRTISSDTYQGRGIAKVLTSLYPRAEKVSVVYVDNDYGKALAGSFIDAFSDGGGNIGQQIPFEEGRGDYDGICTELAEEQPDAVVLISYAEEAALIMNTAREAGMDDMVWIGSEALIDDELIAETGTYSEGMVATMQANRVISEQFTERYQELYNRSAVNWPVPYGYDTMMMVSEAIEARGYTSEGIVEGLKDIRYVGLCGAKSFDENGDIYPAYDVLQVQDGEWVQIRWNDLLYASTDQTAAAH